MIKKLILLFCFLPLFAISQRPVVDTIIFKKDANHKIWKIRIHGDTLWVNGDFITTGASLLYWTPDINGILGNTNTGGTVKIVNLPLYKHPPSYFVTSYDSTNNRLTKYPVSTLINQDSIVNDTAHIDLGCTNLIVYSLADSTRWQHHPITNSNGDTIGCEWRDVSSLPIIPNYWTEDTTHKKQRIWVTNFGDSLIVGGYKPKAKFQVEGDMIVSNVPVGSRTPERMVVQDTVTGKFKRLPIPTGATYSAGYRMGLSGTTFNNVSYWKDQDTVKTTLTGLLKATAGKLSVAILGTDYDNYWTKSGNYLYMAHDIANMFLGNGSGNGNTTGYSNVAIGRKALYSNTTNSNLIAIGDSALYSNTSGYSNTALGSKSLYHNGIGYDNTGIGYASLYGNTDGQANTAIGYNAGLSNTTGNYNTAIGQSALSANHTGIANTAIGGASILSTTGGYNTAIGYQAGEVNITGTNNIYLGYNALSTGTEPNNASYRMYLGCEDTTAPGIYFNRTSTKKWGRWNGTMLIQTLPTESGTPSYSLVTDATGLVKIKAYSSGSTYTASSPMSVAGNDVHILSDSIHKWWTSMSQGNTAFGWGNVLVDTGYYKGLAAYYWAVQQFLLKWSKTDSNTNANPITLKYFNDHNAPFPGFGTSGSTAAFGNHVHAWSAITSGLPTTLSGYGITDAAPLAHKTTEDAINGIVKVDGAANYSAATTIATTCGQVIPVLVFDTVGFAVPDLTTSAIILHSYGELVGVHPDTLTEVYNIRPGWLTLRGKYGKKINYWIPTK